MQSIYVNTGSTGSGYTVAIGAGLLERLGELMLQQSISPCRALIITDSTVGPLYAATVERSLTEAGFTTSTFTFAAGEQSKNIQTLSDALEFMAQEQLTRTDCVFALGGGVVGDVAGFAAGCYLRGIRYVQLPTTLLAAVDSAIGGKTGIDLPQGKNLAGLFWQPSAVVCDTSCLATLPKETLLDGVVEAIKTGVLGDEALFDLLEQEPAEANLEAIIASCVAFKARVVEADERESEVRKILNLGHTIGHAIEVCSDYRVSHGQAVSAGLAMIARAALVMGYCDERAAYRIIQLLTKLGLPTETEFSTEELTRAALHDKKRSGNRITLVLPVNIGSYLLHNISIEELRNVINFGRVR
ncbi:MAG: 3-dehydroquinate synthase [Coriobacteriia bacterium]|nr:3-dehydroquinate synthase [Coriobacteriia bacterium]MCL2750886.1 3-dehydroquinate synthase [Coriobacteriia bacterium]